MKKVKIFIFLLLTAINFYLMAVVANNDIDDTESPIIYKNRSHMIGGCEKTGRTLMSEFRYYISTGNTVETRSTWITKEEFRCDGKGTFYL